LGNESQGGFVRHIVVRNEPHAVSDLERLPIRTPRGRIFHLGELARVVPEEDAGGSFTRIDGDAALPLVIMREPSADAIATAVAVRAALDAIRPTLPAGIRLAIVSDDSQTLRAKLRDLVARGVIAFASVAVVLLIALRNVRGVVLVMGSAAVAIAGTALGLFVFGIPANLLTLAGLGMGVGILVQDGLIVVDRLSTVPDTVDGRADAGTRIFPVVLGATLTTVVVLIPFLYLQGNARAAFMPFAAAFALALGWSVVSAVLVIPSVAAGHGLHRRRWRSLHRTYAGMMRGLLRWRWTTIAVTIAIMAGVSWLFYKNVPRYAWSNGSSQPSYIAVAVSFPRGSDPDTPDRTIREFEAMAVRRAGVSHVTVNGDRRGAAMKVEFTPDAEATALPLQLRDELTQRGVLVGGASIAVSGFGAAFSSGSGAGSTGTFHVRIRGFSYDGVVALADNLKQRLQAIPRVRDVRITAGNIPQPDPGYLATLAPNREALARFGVTAAQFTSVVAREMGGAPSGGTTLMIGGDEVRVTIKSEGARVRTLDELRETIVPNAIGRSPVRIGDLATVGEREALASITRDDQQYVRMMSYDFRGPTKLAQRTHAAFMASIAVPVGYSVVDNDDTWERDDSEKGLWLVFGIGVTLVVLVVAIVFNSVWAAAMVFLSLPIALTGVMAAFWMARAAFTREAAVGVILVVGLAVHQSIFVVDGALERRRRNEQRFGRSFLRASDVYRAALDRAGMTMLVTLATLASVLPLAINTKFTDLFGAIALATAGGTIAGTLGAMFVMPAMMSSTRSCTWSRPPLPFTGL
jgi:HAE1 family hydrophobic/amphiphilic exporter-1